MQPALARTATWDVVAWNRAAAAALFDYGALPPERRNILCVIFGDGRLQSCDLGRCDADPRASGNPGRGCRPGLTSL
ncbi:MULTISPECIES: MmyB family transcriptional regulator [Phenylobacterium]|uniref:MmyB family transcriptional regulator n=1 Tax=Phenylobacterium TaxID=20 RepID=UPI0033961351